MSTTVTGTIVDGATNLVTSGAFVRFELRGTQGIQPMVTGVGTLAQGSGAGRSWFVDFAPNASGVISGSVYSTRDSTGLLAGEITVNGSGTACWWEVSLWRNGKKFSSVHTHAKNGATLDVGALTPITATPVVTAPTGDSTYARLDGGNQPFGGLIQFLQGLILGAGKLLAWGSVGTASVDTGLSRTAAKTVAVGNGTQGDASGGLLLATVNKVAITQPATGSTLTIVDGKTAKIDNTLELAGPDGSVQTFQATGTIVSRTSTDVMTNKTLTAPVITSPSTTGTDSGAATMINKVFNGPGVTNVVTYIDEQGPLAAVVGTGADATLYTKPIGANIIAASKGIKVTIFTKHTTGTGAVTYKLALGGVTVESFAITSNANVADDTFTFNIWNNSGVQNAQHWSRYGMFISTASYVFGANHGTFAANAANALALTYTMNAAGTEQVTPAHWIVELIQ